LLLDHCGSGSCCYEQQCIFAWEIPTLQSSVSHKLKTRSSKFVRVVRHENGVPSFRHKLSTQHPYIRNTKHVIKILNKKKACPDYTRSMKKMRKALEILQADKGVILHKNTGRKVTLCELKK